MTDDRTSLAIFAFGLFLGALLVWLTLRTRCGIGESACQAMREAACAPLLMPAEHPSP